MSDLGELYQEVILDHNRSPRNFRRIEGANRTAQGNNPLCGDEITLYVKVEDGVIREIGFQGSGCAISKASASLMTTSVEGKTQAEAEELFEKVHKMLTGEVESNTSHSELGKLSVLGGVCNFPVRVKCATLSWHTLRAALKGEKETTTE